MPTENAEGSIESEVKLSIGKFSTMRAFRCLQIGAGPSAFAVGVVRDISKKNALGQPLGHRVVDPPKKKCRVVSCVRLA